MAKSSALVTRPLAYSLQKAAVALEVSVTKLQRAISHGLIRSIRLGGSVRITARELDRLLDDGLPTIPARYKPKHRNDPRGRPKTRRVKR